MYWENYYLTNTNDKKEAREDNDDENKQKKIMINPQLLPLHARRLQHTAIGWGGGGLVWTAQEYSFLQLQW